ncbi:hypothetical protein IWX90DRAFT_475840 [Phyllosticta citrichinensis]|uniref:RRM domain-containing protein n=1 Tax=Phyllosticta citrichinensis TaxID=1130410 RepID=A0ABR1Y528_9PEZI
MATTAVEDAARQERREKKKALRKAREAEAAESHDDQKSIRKRKRSNLPDEGELEVDVTAPEPLSKREQRLAKKGKFDPKFKSTAPPKSTSPDQAESGDEEDAGASKEKKEKEKDKKRKEKSEHGIWIGNLPWTATRDTLREFLVKHAGIEDSSITRINMPSPDKAAVARMTIKPQNKGFAYVDFDNAPALQAAIGVSETLMSGRRVLIKDATSYEGRPSQQQGSGEGGEAKGPGISKTQAMQVGGGKEPSKRIFVGNLTFDVTREDLVQHYSKCGEVADVFLATFQDSGKCKGYGWVTFETIDAASAAVAGYVRVPVGGDDDSSDEEMEDADAAEDNGEKATGKKAKKPKKMRKWFVNRLAGRDLRVEFAEDKQTRYKKRYGKDAKPSSGGEADEVREGRPRREPKKVDARTIKPGAALANAPRASGAIVEGQGKKITFD